MQKFVVVDAGLTGFSAVSALASEAGDAQIIWIGDEADAPYDRPSLSKNFLTSNDASLIPLG